jgi:DNA topoisomerase-3
VVNVERSELKLERPVGLNTVELLSYASKNLGLSAIRTMKIAESLYSYGFISYPRTESTSFSKNFDYDRTLEFLEQP